MRFPMRRRSRFRSASNTPCRCRTTGWRRCSGDFYWQADSWARIFNDNPYDRIDGYTNVNLALILTSANGWQVMGYVKNVFNMTAITGTSSTATIPA